MAEQIALTHHEKWDGTGYPARLAGVAIPLAGRIVALADVFDALCSPRPYKPSWTTADARAEIEQQSGGHFDPACVAAFLAGWDEIEALIAIPQSGSEGPGAAAPYIPQPQFEETK